MCVRPRARKDVCACECACMRANLRSCVREHDRAVRRWYSHQQLRLHVVIVHALALMCGGPRRLLVAPADDMSLQLTQSVLSNRRACASD